VITLLCQSSTSSKEFLESIVQSSGRKPPAKVLLDALTSQGRPLIELFQSIRNGQRTVALHVQHEAEAALPSVGLFTVGDMVSVPRRKQEGVNEDGGVGEVRTVEAKTVAGTRVVFYSVKYVLDRRVEKDVPESLLARYSIADGDNPRRSLDSAAAATSAAEERTSEKLRRENSKLQNRIRDLEAEAARSRMKWVGVRADYKSSATDLSKKVENLAVEKTAQFERMQRGIDDLLETAIRHAQDEAASAGNEVLEERRQQMLKQRKEHAKDMKELERQVQDSKAAHNRLEAAVAGMLQDTAAAAAAEAQSRVAEVEAALEKANQEVSDLEHAARVLGVDVPSRLTASTGANSLSASDLGRNERTAIVKTAVGCVVRIVEIAAPNGDTEGLGLLLNESGKLSQLFGG
jgi:hypothetical protein